jgi:hypothetical protein
MSAFVLELANLLYDPPHKECYPDQISNRAVDTGILDSGEIIDCLSMDTRYIEACARNKEQCRCGEFHQLSPGMAGFYAGLDTDTVLDPRSFAVPSTTKTL